MQERTETSPVATSRRGWKSLLSLGLAAVACPCHLPIVAGLLAGTTLGAWLSQHSVIVTLVMLGVFVGALLYGLRSLNDQPLAGDVTKDKYGSPPSGETETTRVGGR